MAYIEMKNSTKLYHMGSTTITANDNVSFTIEQGELAIILGASGAGKSTVLNILGGMDANTSGQVIIDGKDISNYTPKQLTAYRRTDIGFVFQFYNLVANLTAREKRRTRLTNRSRRTRRPTGARRRRACGPRRQFSRAVVGRRAAACGDRSSGGEESEDSAV